MKRYFHEELEDVRSHLMLMAEKAQENVRLAMRALFDSDLLLARQAKDADDAVDAIEQQIDDEVARYISLRAPVARDLRLLFVAIKASHNLERVGDEATSIANRARKILAAGHLLSDFGSVARMRDLALGMVSDAMRCFIQEDSAKAVTISKRDKEVDELNRENFLRFMEIMKKDPNLVPPYLELIFISKSLERVADHAQNIAEEVYYLLTTRSLKDDIRAEAKA